MSAGTAKSVELPQQTDNGRARAAAMQAHSLQGAAAVKTIGYRSQGNVLIIGAGKEAIRCAQSLQPALHPVLLMTADAKHLSESATGIRLVTGRLLKLEGYLGHFAVTVKAGGQTLKPPQLFGDPIEYADLILDLGPTPAMQQELPPLGYFAPRDASALEQAVNELKELIGDFEKPQFFAYDAAICAHGRSGLTGCRRCLDACPTLAIQSLGDTVEVDPYLCQGGGSCASSCPTGAIRYTYPNVSVALTAVRQALHRYREQGGRDPQVLFYDSNSGQQALTALAAQLPESVLPFQVEELGSLGMDTWLATLAYGARRVALFTTEAIPQSVMREISLQLNYAGAILEGLGYRHDSLRLILDGTDSDLLSKTLTSELPFELIPPAGFTAFDDKRTTLRLAIDHLYQHAPQPQFQTPLPTDSPFGEIEIDPQLCTLCMACVSVCPAKALYAGNERPALQFIEGNCVQCGLCHTACPEDAVHLVPRFCYDQDQRWELRTLHEEEPFHCIRCGQPFATRSVVERMTERLAAHWMFSNETERRRIRMCQDCRVLDIFEREGDLNVYDKPRPQA